MDRPDLHREHDRSPGRALLRLTALTLLAAGLTHANGWAQTTSSGSTVLHRGLAPQVIQTRVVAKLGDEGDGTVGPDFSIAADRAGRFLVSPFARRSEILSFASSGRFVSAHGRKGQGPGEFRYIAALAVGTDLIHAFDPQNGRWTRLNSDFTLNGSSRVVGYPLDVVVFGDTLAVVNAILRTSERIGFPLHLVSTDGWVVRSFGYDEQRSFRSDVGLDGYRVLARAGEESVWAIAKTQYFIEEWSLSGELLRSFERRVPWFEPHHDQPMPHPDHPPVPTVSAVQQDRDGLVWVAIAVADEQWVEGIHRSQYNEGTGFQISSHDDFFDTMIEAIDPDTGEVVATTRIDQQVWSFVGERQVATYAEEDGLWPTITIWELYLDEGRDLRPTIEATSQAIQERHWSRLVELLQSNDHELLSKASPPQRIHDLRR